MNEKFLYSLSKICLVFYYAKALVGVSSVAPLDFSTSLAAFGEVGALPQRETSTGPRMSGARLGTARPGPTGAKSLEEPD